MRKPRCNERSAGTEFLPKSVANPNANLLSKPNLRLRAGKVDTADWGPNHVGCESYGKNTTRQTG